MTIHSEFTLDYIEQWQKKIQKNQVFSALISNILPLRVLIPKKLIRSGKLFSRASKWAQCEGSATNGSEFTLGCIQPCQKKYQKNLEFSALIINILLERVYIQKTDKVWKAIFKSFKMGSIWRFWDYPLRIYAWLNTALKEKNTKKSNFLSFYH